jgi:hypothetical protein
MATNKSYLNNELDPVSNWNQVESTFAKEISNFSDYIKKNAKIDIPANRANSLIIKQIQKKISSAKFFMILFFVFALCFATGAILGAVLDNLITSILCGIGVIVSIAMLIVMHCKKKTHTKTVDSYIQIGYEQMKEVNANINSSTLINMINIACSP